jgi:rubrerythrin
MKQITEKELTGLSELLNEEELLVHKFRMLANHCEDAEVKAKFEDIANQHQSHYNSLYEQVK